MVRPVVVRHEFRCLHSRSARPDLGRFLQIPLEHGWKVAGGLDALALSERDVLDRLRIHPGSTRPPWRSSGEDHPLWGAYRRSSVARAESFECSLAAGGRFTFGAEQAD